MPGVKRCGIKVNADGTLNEEGKSCALKAGHTETHKPRVTVTVSSEDLAAMVGTVSVVTEAERLAEVRRTRSTSDSPLGQLALQVTQGAYDAWVRGGKHLNWTDTPAIALDVPKSLESKLRSEIHAAAAQGKRKVQFGDSKPIGNDGKLVKMFFQVRDLPAPKPADEVKADTATPAETQPSESDAQKAVANARRERAK